ncbi:F-box/WD repeat-containing protein 7 [Hondaea fermentalgiana]|uniref:F-box/WD repeat-containing protein 7 n=1 Tax=Hondaea fermentalgiana TaxID=2315210 RepID=A0A2R5GH91_9STRA|nr:F-box/WD repeat-containing protein 7 [Hondaea fermentalgiana]|eukprot:GBG29955.1 F-box/WD repeat-containing protein 7 [Hondaea fermentalgiana]
MGSTAAPEHVLVRVLVVRASPRASRYLVYAQAVDPLAFGAWERRRASVKQGKNRDARAAAGPGEPEGEDDDGFLNGTSSCERGAINDGSEIDSEHAHGASEHAHGASSSNVASCADYDDKDDDDDDEVPGMGTIHTLKVHARGLSQARLERLIAYHLLRDALDPYGNRQTNLQTLPRHLWLSVMEHLEMGDVLATLKVCKRSHAWHQDNLLWKTLLERDRIMQESGDLRLQVWGPRLPAGLVRRISTLAQSLSCPNVSVTSRLQVLEDRSNCEAHLDLKDARSTLREELRRSGEDPGFVRHWPLIEKAYGKLISSFGCTGEGQDGSIQEKRSETSSKRLMDVLFEDIGGADFVLCRKRVSTDSWRRKDMYDLERRKGIEAQDKSREAVVKANDRKKDKQFV